MELNSEEVLRLEEYVNKCRCCFRELSGDQKFIKITNIIEQKFYNLTSLKLIQNDEYSKFICNLCDNDLEVFSNFRMSLIDKQRKLYSVREGFLKNNFIPETSSHSLFPTDPTKIKTEVDDFFNDTTSVGNTEEDIFIDCSNFISSDLKVESGFDLAPLELADARKRTKKQEIDNAEHQKLLEEFKAVLNKRKDKSVECPRCFKLLHRDSIKEHINVVHFKLNKFSCEQLNCNYTASRYGRLMLHMKAIHKCEIDSKYEQSKPKKQCTVCGAMVRNWRRHVMKVHLNIKNFHCDICSHGSFFKSDMEIHMKVHAKKEPKEPQKFFCEMCGLEFEKRFHLNAHVKAKHTVKERIHNCTICEKSFFSTENLKKHIESHGAKDMPCEFCGKLFSCMNNLRTHLYYHSDPKFICDFPGCDKKFYMRKRLRAHVKTHKGQKDFACSFCDKCYFSQNDLNRHLFSIHQKMRFFCEVPGCHGNFSRREYYKKHALAHHQSLGLEGMELLLQKIKDAQPLQKY